MTNNGNGRAVATAENSVTVAMAERYGMTPQAFEATVRHTCGAEKLTREEFAAFLLVAKEYSLNPITREIYAMPKRGGGVVPIVSVDGWIHLVNDHRALDGIEFLEHKKQGKLEAITCRIWRKDRSRPTEVKEYLDECKRDTDPWKTMPHRMLRHKALIQGGRVAFGFSGIFDEEEGRIVAGARDITPMEAPPPPQKVPEKEASPVSAAQPEGTATPEVSTPKRKRGEPRQSTKAYAQEAEEAQIVADPFTSKEVEDYLDDLAARYGQAKTPEDVDDVHGDAEENGYPRMLPMDVPRAEHLYQSALGRFDE